MTFKEKWNDAWDGFQAGKWNKEVNLRDFIQLNYTPYDGDDSFLAGPTQNTKDLWAQVMDLTKQEREAGGVLDMDTKVVSTIISHNAGYIDKNLEKIYHETFEKMEETNKGNLWKNRWFPIQKGEEFERILKEKVRKELEGYDTIKKVTTIKIGNNIDIIKLMEEIKKENNNLGGKKDEIDKEVKRKIKERGEFKGVSEREKKEFIEIVIEEKGVNFKEEYNKMINYIDKKKKEFIFQISMETGLMIKDVEEIYKKDIEKISRNYLKNEGKKYERKD